MKAFHRARWWRSGLLVVCLCGGVAAEQANTPQLPQLPRDDVLQSPRRLRDREKLSKEDEERYKRDEAEVLANLPQPAPSILPGQMNQVDLACVLRLAGINNPEILIARQRVLEAQATKLFALSFALPNLNAGANYDAHTGNLQQSSGNILEVNRNAFYLGSGAGAVAAGTVGIPGVFYLLNPSEGMFRFLAVRYNVQVRRYENLAVRNQMLLRVADAYMELLRAEGHRAIALQNQREAHEIARLTGVYAKEGAARDADANRAASELARRNQLVVQAEQEVLVASARLDELLNIPTSVQLHTIEERVVPIPLIPSAVPLHDLLLIALAARPELAARRMAIREAFMNLRSAQFLPFSPTVWAGFSAGTFGGGSNLISQPGGFQGFQQPRFDSFAPRTDVDTIVFWTATNAGLGNLALMRIRRRQEQMAELELVRTLNTVRNDVAVAHARIHGNFAQIDIAERGINSGYKAFQQDLTTTTTGGPRVVLPIELLNSFRLTAEARYAFLDAIVGFNKAQFAMYVALGQPPADALAKAIPPDPSTGGSLVQVPASAPQLPACAGPNGAPCAGLLPPPGGHTAKVLAPPCLPKIPPFAGGSLAPEPSVAPAVEKETNAVLPRTMPGSNAGNE